MRKIMQELDRIYFKPLFHKKCQFLLKNNQVLVKKRKRKLSKMVMDLKNNQDLRQKCKNDKVNQITLRYIDNDSNLRKSKSSVSIKTLKPLDEEETRTLKAKYLFKKRIKVGQDLLLKKPKVKISRKLRLWLVKRQIFILRRKLVNKIENSVTFKSKIKIMKPKIWR